MFIELTKMGKRDQANALFQEDRLELRLKEETLLTDHVAASAVFELAGRDGGGLHPEQMVAMFEAYCAYLVRLDEFRAGQEARKTNKMNCGHYVLIGVQREMHGIYCNWAVPKTQTTQ